LNETETVITAIRSLSVRWTIYWIQQKHRFSSQGKRKLYDDAADSFYGQS